MIETEIRCYKCGAPIDLVPTEEYEANKSLYDHAHCNGCSGNVPEHDPRDYDDEFDNGPTGHGDICMSDADPGL